jgi:hypothetical protein
VIKGDFPQGSDPAQATAGIVSALGAEFRTMGYEEAGGPQAQFGVNITVMEKDSVGIVFTITIRPSQPNVEILGKTECLPAK